MDMKPIKNRMSELGLDLAGLNRKYCDLRQKKGDKSAVPNKRRGMLVRILSEESEPTLQTLQDLLEVLGGELVIRWVKVEEVPISSSVRSENVQLMEEADDRIA